MGPAITINTEAATSIDFVANPFEIGVADLYFTIVRLP